MNDSQAIFQQALNLQQQGKIDVAIALYRQVLDTAPEASEVLHFLGLALHQNGDSEAGLIYIEQSLGYAPNHIPYLYNLARIYAELKQFSKANIILKNLIKLQPSDSQFWFDLGYLHQQLNEHKEAILYFGQAINLNPEFTQAYNNMGNSLRLIDELQKSMAALEKAVKLAPESAQINYNLGLAYTQQGREEDAITFFQKSLAIEPDNADALYNLGAQLCLISQYTKAIETLEKALKIKPDFIGARYTLGVAYIKQGFTDKALIALKEILKQDNSHAGAFWNYCLALPALYQDEAEISYFRQRYTAGWQRIQATLNLNTETGKQWALNGIFSFTTFPLQYHGQNDKDLQKQYGDTLCSITQVNYPEFCKPLTLTKKQRIRVGFISNRVAGYGVGRIILGWLIYLDKSQFEIYFYQMEYEQNDFTRRFEQAAAVFRHVPNDWQKIAECILKDELDILVFAELSLDIPMMQLAGLRLAPIQCTTWGHTVTSGLPTIDYFISNAAMEPPDGEHHYTEQLVCLPKIGSCISTLEVPELTRTRSYFGLPEHKTIYLSRQNPLKYLPQYDFIYPAIAIQCPTAHFGFVSNFYTGEVGRQLKERLSHAFTQANLLLEDYCTFLPHTSYEDYWNLNLLSEVFLDTFGWSGCLTTLEAVACSLPVVTCPGTLMQSRQSAGILQVMGVTETIAATPEEYIDLAVRLGQDLSWRWEVAQRMYEGQDELFEDQSCIKVLEEFFRQACQSLESIIGIQ